MDPDPNNGVAYLNPIKCKLHFFALYNLEVSKALLLLFADPLNHAPNTKMVPNCRGSSPMSSFDVSLL